MSSFVACELEN